MSGVFEWPRIQSSAEAWAEELQHALSAQEESINSRIYMRQLMRLNRSYISELPDELLVKIFFEVATESPRHLLSIVKTCKAFHDMAIPLLYSSLELLSGRSREYMQSLGMSFRRHPQRRGYAIEAKLRGSPETFRSLGQIPVIFSPDAFPNIKRLHGIRVDVSSLQNILTADEPSTGTSTIEELIFEESEIRIWPAGLDALLSACRIVRKLVLHWGCGAAESPRNGEFLQEAMGLAIARHAATLETLKLMPNEAQISTDSQSEPGSLKDRLPSFSVLKDLTIHMVCFDGGGQTQFTLNMGATAQLGLVNFLPPSLERLALAANPESLTGNPASDSVLAHRSLRLQICSLLQHCGSNNRFSKLKLIQLPEWANDPTEGLNGDELPKLKELASSFTVHIIFKGMFERILNYHHLFSMITC